MAGAYRTIRDELAFYGHGLAEKPEIVGLNKIDAIDPEAVSTKCRELQHAADLTAPVRPLSGATSAGVPDVIGALLVALSRARTGKDDDTPIEAERLVHMP